MEISGCYREAESAVKTAVYNTAAKAGRVRGRRSRLAFKEGMVGILFLIPWIIGFIFFFAKPLVTSLIYSFHKITFAKYGIDMVFVGWDNYQDALFADAALMKGLPGLIGQICFQVPVIALYSLLIALLLNQKFPGRTFFRTVFFLPVIVATPVIMSLLTRTGMDTETVASSNVFLFTGNGVEAIIKAIMGQYGLSSGIVAVSYTHLDVYKRQVYGDAPVLFHCLCL